ncbi:unnamed protein product [Candidula unifasciata]|uniref:Thioredoxin domain-containing protein n=1 Tax=Candidula unifasciata TaxID=100452 RepID=A0A8S3Z6G0_9EUPU|nr:unnamed protein product [Candidula unifasciata]
MQNLILKWSKYIALLAIATSLIVHQTVDAQEEAGYSSSSIKDIDLSAWQQSYNEKQKLLVLFYQPDTCDRCVVALNTITQIVGQPEIPADLEIVKSSNPDLVSALGVRQFPSLVYLREQSYVTYDGSYDVEDVLEWVQQATNQVTRQLDDLSFEHLTQAATGATTGDWLVAFYTDSCRSILPVLDTLGVRVRGRINVAKVNIAENPGLVERFKIAGCPEVILFKQSKMYKCTLPNLDVATLKSFVDGFYKNMQAQVIPLPKSHFDLITESIADYIKVQLEGENKSIVLAGAFAAAVIFLLIIFCCCRSAIGDTSKQKTE